MGRADGVMPELARARLLPLRQLFCALGHTGAKFNKLFTISRGDSRMCSQDQH